MRILSSKLLTGDAEEIKSLQQTLMEAPEYSYRTSGGPPTLAEAQSLFSSLPPDKSYEDKFVLRAA